jgi:Domain of Unknown Function with PDB structure (DUF3857)/Transglutaminase-like superfamily
MRLEPVTLAWALLASAAMADPAQVQLGPPPSWVTPSPLMDEPSAVTGPIFVRRRDMETHIDGHGVARYADFRYKILQQTALGLGNVAVEYGRFGTPVVHCVRVYRDGSVIDVLKLAKFEFVPQRGNSGGEIAGARLTAVLRIPDLRVGDELEVALTTFTDDPAMGAYSSGFLNLEGYLPPGRYHLGLSWDPGHEPHVKMTDDAASAATKTAERIDLHFDNPKFVKPPNDAPPRDLLHPMVEFSTYPDWNSVSRHLAQLYAKASRLSPGSAVKQEALEIAKAEAAPLARAAAALKWVQQNVKTALDDLSVGDITPASADDTWQRRQGDSKVKAALLLALLDELGIKAEPVLIDDTGADQGLDRHQPSPQLFRHALVRASVDGATYWLDASLPAVAEPGLQPPFPTQTVLPLSTSGSAMESREWHPASVPDDIQLFEIDAREGFEKPSRIVLTTIKRGIAGLKEAIELSKFNAAELEAEYKRRMGSGSPFEAINGIQWHYDRKARASILKVSGMGKTNWELSKQGVHTLALPKGGNPAPNRRARVSESDMDVPFYSKPFYHCYATTVRVPNSTRPEQWASKDDIDETFFGTRYHRAWEFRDGAIRMVVGTRVERLETDRAAAERDNERIASFDNSKGIISHDPRRTEGVIGRGERVPATYDLDWTADKVPCLSSD